MARKPNNSPTTKTKVQTKLQCLCCGKEYDSESFYISNSIQFKAIKKLPYCIDCLDNIYNDYKNEYIKLEYDNPEKKAVQRVCMAFDLYYSDKIYDSAVRYYSKKSHQSKNSLNFISFYFQQLKLAQYKNKNYNSTVANQHQEAKEIECLSMVDDNNNDIKNELITKAKKFFGSGFDDNDYLFLQEQYEDWTTRHECQTKSQEEMFKQICFTQLELLKATRAKMDTKDLQATFLKQLEASKLQPKQNKNNTLSESQTFGTLIDKLENTRPVADIDEDLQDVDNIGLLLDVFFRGHLAKFMGLKNGLSKIYDKYMKKYTVEKPEYQDEEDTEALFDSIFGSQVNMED